MKRHPAGAVPDKRDVLAHANASVPPPGRLTDDEILSAVFALDMVNADEREGLRQKSGLMEWIAASSVTIGDVERAKAVFRHAAEFQYPDLLRLRDHFRDARERATAE